MTWNLLGQDNLIYHQYEQSASDYNIIKWNINKDSLAFYKWYVRETIDNKGRVSRLDFLESGQLNKNRLCYLPDFIIYKYPDCNTIIEELYNADGTPMNGIECEVPYKRIYRIDKGCNIISLQLDYYVDSVSILKAGQTSKDVKIELDYINKVKNEVSTGIYKEFNASFIWFYFKSYMKYNRKFPVKQDFKKEHISVDNIENRDALNCIKE
jgi:hypothetical protein